MMTVMWVVLCLVVYFVGFIVTGAIEQRYICGKYRHDYCGHPWQTPVPLVWPIALVLALPTAPIFYLFRNMSQLSRQLAEFPTLAERRAEREKTRKTERKELVGRVHKLESELGYPLSKFDDA